MTQHPSEEDLILYYYGEAAPPDTAGHLASCAACREQYQSLQRVLNVVDMPVPEPEAAYEDRVWNRIAPRLGKAPARRWLWFAPRQWAAAAAVACLLVVAFVAGRYSPNPPAEIAGTAVQNSNGPVRERVLVVAVGDHLERSQMILVELVNAPDQTELDITDEQSTAEDLLFANRLYRQTASATGNTGLVTLLDDLERVLADVVHRPGNISAEELEDLRQRIDSQGLIFKMRVMGSQLNERIEKPAAAQPEPESKQL